MFHLSIFFGCLSGIVCRRLNSSCLHFWTFCWLFHHTFGFGAPFGTLFCKYSLILNFFLSFFHFSFEPFFILFFHHCFALCFSAKVSRGFIRVGLHLAKLSRSTFITTGS